MTRASHTAIVLAADRGPDDPVACASGSPCKALTLINGQPMLWRVLNALRASPAIGDIIVVGPSQEILAGQADLKNALVEANITWMAPATSPSMSAAKALQTVPIDQPVLLTTADHALLQPSMVESLIAGSRDLDFALAMVPYQTVMDAYPNTRRTAIRLRPGKGYCGCNLFLISSNKGRQLIEMWQSVETQRKHPAKLVIGMLGWKAVVRYMLRHLTLEQAFSGLSASLNMKLAPVLLDNPCAAIDVDSSADLELVRRILASDASYQTKQSANKTSDYTLDH